MLNTTLSTLVTMLKAAIGDNLSVGTANDTAYQQRLADKQQQLTGEYDFPYIMKAWDVGVSSGSRFNNLPVAASTVDGVTKTLDLSRPFQLEVLYANRWKEVLNGIDSREYNSLSSDVISNGSSQVVIQSLDPIMRYKLVSSTSFEVWPVPQSSSTLRFYGQAQLSTLTSVSDTADLDDQLIVNSLAVDILSKRKSADAQALLAVAQKRLLNLRASLQVREDDVIIGGRMDTQQRKLVPIIGVH